MLQKQAIHSLLKQSLYMKRHDFSEHTHTQKKTTKTQKVHPVSMSLWRVVALAFFGILPTSHPKLIPRRLKGGLRDPGIIPGRTRKDR